MSIGNKAVGSVVIATWLTGVVLSIGIPIAIVVVVIHFVHKLW